MGKVNIAVECNMEHRASIYALLTSIVANKGAHSQYFVYMLLGASSRANWDDILSIADENVEIRFFDKALDELRGVGKLIYLKWNTLVMGDLSEFYSVDLEGKSFAAVENLPNKEYVVPESGEVFNTSVLLLDTDIPQDTTDYKQISIFYNYGYEEFVRNQNKISGDRIGMNPREYVEVRDWALILRIDEEISPEKYYDGPLAQVWMKYYKLSPIGKEPLKRVAYVETVGEAGISDEQTIPVLLCVEDSDVVYTITLISSMEEKLARERTLDIRIVYSQLSMEHKKMLMQMDSQRVNIVLCNIQKYTLKQIRTCKEVIASLAFAEYDKAICLDTKIICEEDISLIYDLSMEDYLIRARRAVRLLEGQENVQQEHIYLKNIAGIDTSVSIVNVKRWIENNINEQVQALLNNGEYMKYSVQDILNIMCMKQRAFIHEEFTICVCNEQEEKYRELVEAYISKSPWSEKLAKEKIFYETREDDNVREVLVEMQKLEADNKQLQEANQKLKAENKQLSVQNKRLSTDRERFLYEILEIRKSVTYKIGRALTLIPRKLRGDK